MREGNAYWNRNCNQWTSKELATGYSDSEVSEIELSGDAELIIDYEETTNVG